MLSFLQKSFPDFKENCRDNVNENQTCYSNEDVYVIPTNDNNGNNNNLKEIGHESDDISFDNAEYINNLKDPNDDDKNFDDLKSALPTMRSDFRVR